MGNRIVIAAGGTGGHILPGICVGQELAKVAHVDYISGTREVERLIYESHGLQPITLRSSKNPRRLAPVFKGLNLTLDIQQVLRQFLRNRPRAILAMGGAVCGPVLLAAILLRIPYFLHDSNAVPGRVTKLFAKYARTVFLGFPCKVSGSSQVVGTPVRHVVREYVDRRVVLCMGGSQGASALNAAFVAAANALDDPLYRFVLISGPGKHIDNPGAVEVHEYVSDIPTMLAETALAVSRSGAGSLAELAAAAVPSILIPYPFAKDDHQNANAKFFAETDASIVMAEKDLTSESLRAAMENLLNDDAYRARFAEAMKAHARLNAAEDIAKQIMELTSKSQKPLTINPSEARP